jgi:hemerythrin-like domain-containing protein
VTLVPLRSGGPPPPRSEDVPDALIDCHAKMRQFTALALELSLREGVGEEEVREVAARVHRYFTVALPLHEEDEESSLFPRLLARAPELEGTISSLRQDHEAHARQVAELLGVCAVLKAQPERAEALKGELASAAQALAETWKHHLASEEKDVFPKVTTALDAEERAAIREEMRARRARLPAK